MRGGATEARRHDRNAVITDRVPRDAPGTREIGFALPERYNATAILFDNLAAGRGSRTAVTGPAGTRTYAELAADASRFGAGLLSLGARRGDRVLLFLDDTPAYPAALFGAIARRPGAGADQHADAAGPAAVLSGRLWRPHRHQRRSLRRPLRCRPPARAPGSTRSSSSTASRQPAPAVATRSAAEWLAGPARRCRPPTPTATTWRSGCTRRAPPAGPRASCTCSTTWPTRTSPTRAICWR